MRGRFTTTDGRPRGNDVVNKPALRFLTSAGGAQEAIHQRADLLRAAACDAAFTTVMSWAYFRGKLVYNGVQYDAKASEYERFHDLPHFELVRTGDAAAWRHNRVRPWGADWTQGYIRGGDDDE